MNKTVKLNNGVEMPILGYGVYQIAPEECERCVLDAISVGYRSIDTAQAYYNEEGVGKAISKCGVPRDELFITTKIWVTNAGEEKAKASIDESLRKLQTEYVIFCSFTSLLAILWNISCHGRGLPCRKSPGHRRK